MEKESDKKIYVCFVKENGNYVDKYFQAASKEDALEKAKAMYGDNVDSIGETQQKDTTSLLAKDVDFFWLRGMKEISKHPMHLDEKALIQDCEKRIHQTKEEMEKEPEMFIEALHTMLNWAEIPKEKQDDILQASKFDWYLEIFELGLLYGHFAIFEPTKITMAIGINAIHKLEKPLLDAVKFSKYDNFDFARMYFKNKKNSRVVFGLGISCSPSMVTDFSDDDDKTLG